MVDVGGVETLQPLIKAMKQAWLESLQQVDTLEAEEPEDEDWNENLLVERIPLSSSSGRNIQIDIQRISVQLQTDDGTIQFTIDEINTRVHPSSNNTIEFSTATVSIPTIPKPLLAITKSDSSKSMLDFVATGHHPVPGFLINGAQGILDDFLVGDTSRSDDAWGMIRSDAANNSSQYIKIKIPRISIQVSDSKDINAVKKVFSRIQKTMKMFMEESTVVELEKEDDQIDLVVEFALEEGKVAVKLDENEIFEGRWEGVEGTLVNGVAGGEMVGVIDVAKLQVDVTSPQSPRKVLHESINKVHIPQSELLILGKRFHPINRITIRSFSRWTSYFSSRSLQSQFRISRLQSMVRQTWINPLSNSPYKFHYESHSSNYRIHRYFNFFTSAGSTQHVFIRLYNRIKSS